MSTAFIRSAHENIPMVESKIVHDRFHVMKMATDTVDKIRKQEHRELRQRNDQRLTSTKYPWLTSQENLSDTQKERIEEVFSRKLDTSRAWFYKEFLRDLWDYRTPNEGRDFSSGWYRRVIRTKLEPLKKVAKAIKERIEYVVTCSNHPITNAVAEGINSKIQPIKRRVGGFRNRENYKTAIHIYCGGLDLYPH